MLLFHHKLCTFIPIQRLRYPREALQCFVYTPGAIWTIQHLTDTLTFKDHWSHDHMT